MLTFVFWTEHGELGEKLRVKKNLELPQGCSYLLVCHWLGAGISSLKSVFWTVILTRDIRRVVCHNSIKLKTYLHLYFQKINLPLWIEFPVAGFQSRYSITDKYRWFDTLIFSENVICQTALRFDNPLSFYLESAV